MRKRGMACGDIEAPQPARLRGGEDQAVLLLRQIKCRAGKAAEVELVASDGRNVFLARRNKGREIIKVLEDKKLARLP